MKQFSFRYALLLSLVVASCGEQSSTVSDATLDASVSDAATNLDARDGNTGDSGLISCELGFHACGAVCSANSSVLSCGASCTPCASDNNGTATCSNGACSLTCAGGLSLCAGGCHNTLNSNSHCGACNRACTTGQLCLNGACAAPPACGGNNPECPTGYYCNAQNQCAAGCTTATVARDCQATEGCDNNRCVCGAGFHRCGGRCVSDLDVNTCGSSCNPCPSDPNGNSGCNSGSCTVTCSSGFTSCSGRCVRTAQDSQHCGVCNRACSTGQTCVVGTCVAPTTCNDNTPCSAGYYCSPQGQCLVGCGGPSACAANETCNDTHRCECAGGYHRCNGVCVANSSLTTCGQSCTACAVPRVGTATCTGTECDVICPAGTHKCGVDCVPNNNAATCGSSCTPCATNAHASATCSDGVCGLQCQAGYCGAACDSVCEAPNQCAPRAPSGGASTTRNLQARGFSEGSATAIANYSVDFFTNGVVTTVCAAPNCVTATVDAQGNVSPSLPPDWYAYRVVDPASGTSRAGIPTYGFNRIPAGAAANIVSQVSAGTRSLLLTVYGRAHMAGTAIVAGGAVDATGAPRTGATARVFVNGTQITTGTGMPDTFVGYFSGSPGSPTPDPAATAIGANGRFAAANLAVGAGALVRVEIVQSGTVVSCEEATAYPNSATLLNLGPLRADYPSCSGCYPYRVR